MVILLLVFLLLNGFAIQAFEVFTYDVYWGNSIGPSYASLSHDVNLPESFILCTSSKEATFNDVGMYSIYGEDSIEWMIMSIRPGLQAVMLTIDWGGGIHNLGEIRNPRLDFWYHICLKIDSSTKRIEVALNGDYLGEKPIPNDSNMPRKLKMAIGKGQNNKQFYGSVANVQVFKEGNITEITASPCEERRGTILSWKPEYWKVSGSHWLLAEESEEVICLPHTGQYNLAIPTRLTLNESRDICKDKLNNGVIPYPDSKEAFLKYIAWHKKITDEVCHFIWTPLSDKVTEDEFLNMNDNTEPKYHLWDGVQPNGGKDENFVVINVRREALRDVSDSRTRLYCSACSLANTLMLRLDGVCEDSLIGNLEIANLCLFSIF